MNTTWVRYANRPSEIPWSGSKLTEMEELLQKVQQLETENADISHAYGVTRDVVKGLCEELANLKAENAALLAEVKEQCTLNAKGSEREYSLRGRIEQLERENAALWRDVYQCPPTSEYGYEGLKWADAFEVIERDNAALHNELVALKHQTQWKCSCGGTDCEGQRENAALRKEKDKLEVERCEMLRSWDLTINHNAALVEAFAKADVLAEHSRFDGRREWTVVETWVYPNDIIVQMDRAAFNAARKEGQP